VALLDRVSWDNVRRVGSRLTTPLQPDDYLSLLNPLWTTRELRGVVEQVVPETDDAATVVIRPGWGWSYDHHPGQYIGIGIQIKGKFHWRSYSVSSPPERDGKTIAITVRAMPEGFLSEHLVSGVAPGTIIRLALPSGDFVLPNPPPERILFLVGGSGITPVMAMLRTLSRRDTMPDVVLSYSSTTPDRMIFRDELQELVDKHPTLTLHERHTDTDGLLSLDQHLDGLCSDWREREVWACGPGRCLTPLRSSGRRQAWRTSCTSSGSRSTSRVTAARAARSRSATPARPPTSTVPPPCSRRERASGWACRTAAAPASATPAR